MEYRFEIDGAVDHRQFELDWEQQLRTLNGWPPARLSWQGNLLTLRFESLNINEAELRKMLSLALGRQQRKLRP